MDYEKKEKDIFKTIDIITNTYKTKYDIMQTYFNNINYEKRTKHIMTINIGEILTNLERTTDFQNEMLKNNKYENLNTYIGIGLLNLIAHYKHFFSRKLEVESMVILYCSDSGTYDKFAKILVIIDDLVKFIPSMLLIPNTGSNEKYFYNHLLSYTILKIKQVNKKLENDIHVHMISSFKPDLQIMGIPHHFTLFKKIIGASGNILLNKIDTWNEIILRDSKIIFQNPKFTLFLNILVIPILSIMGVSKTDRILDSLKAIKTTKRIKLIESFLYKASNNALPINKEELLEFDTLFGSTVLSEQYEFNTFRDRIVKMRYEYDLGIVDIVNNIIAVSSKKLKDEKLENINDLSNVFDDKKLNIMWLVGY